jgi:outer membrane lipoprotein-sorting protein
MRVLMILAIVVSPLCAQTPDAAGLLQQSGKAPGNYRTVDMTMDNNMDITVAGQTVTTTMTMHLQAALPNRYRVTVKAMDLEMGFSLSDGTTVWNYTPATGEYTKELVDKDGGFLPMYGVEALPVPFSKTAEVTGSASVAIDGQARDCWVVEGAVAQTGAYKLWIDKQNYFILRLEQTGNIDGAPGKMRTTMIVRELKFDEALPNSLFTFQPPAGSTEAKAEDAKVASAAPPVAVTPGEPQAFVLNKQPVRQIQPKLPDHTTVSSGEVQLLIVIDMAGQVSQAEALTGDPTLSQIAADAVRQWSYRPVLRNGHPVYVFTQATVFFDSNEGPASPRSMNKVDFTEQMVAMERITALQRKFPNTPQMEFEDLEQDRATATGIERSFALPDLAKKALKAGAYDKAAVYANELLKQDKNAGNYGQGVHDGHMVLGLIALRGGNVTQARQDLLAAAETPGSPVLDSFGPNMLLAKELIEKGERDSVLEYFSSCKQFWTLGADRLDMWSAIVRKGGMPDFGANLVF